MSRITKLLCGVVVCLVFSVSAVQAQLNVNWHADDAGSYLYNAAGTQLTTDQLFAELVVDANNDTVFANMLSGYVGIGTGTDFGGASSVTPTASDDVVGSWPTGKFTWYVAYSYHMLNTVVSDAWPNSNDFVYIRWFNATNKTDATQAGIVYSSAGEWLVPANEVAPAEDFLFTYGTANTTGTWYDVAGPNDGWQSITPIPEPGTLGLLGLGMLTIAIRKRFSKKA